MPSTSWDIWILKVRVATDPLRCRFFSFKCHIRRFSANSGPVTFAALAKHRVRNADVTPQLSASSVGLSVRLKPSDLLLARAALAHVRGLFYWSHAVITESLNGEGTACPVGYAFRSGLFQCQWGDRTCLRRMTPATRLCNAFWKQSKIIIPRIWPSQYTGKSPAPQPSRPPRRSAQPCSSPDKTAAPEAGSPAARNW